MSNPFIDKAKKPNPFIQKAAKPKGQMTANDLLRWHREELEGLFERFSETPDGDPAKERVRYCLERARKSEALGPPNMRGRSRADVRRADGLLDGVR